MAWVRYRALDQNGKETDGRIEAADIKSALASLHVKGLMAYDAVLESSRGSAWWNRDILSRARLSRNGAAIFARELATLVGADLPLDEALDSIAVQAGQSVTAHIAKDLRERIHSGDALSEALEEAGLFGPSHRSIIAAGEAGGALAAALEQVASFIERENQVRSDIRSALFYPSILLVLAGTAVIFILTVLLPSLKPIFDDADATLPAATAALLTLGVFLKSNGLAITLLICATIALLVSLFQRDDIRAQFDMSILKAPFIGSIIAKTESARIMRTLGILLKNGVTMTRALGIVAAVAGNRRFKSAVHSITTDVKEGKAFLAAFEDAGVFPSLATRLAAAGDRSGQLDAMLLKSADIFETQVKRDIDRFVGLLAPILTLSIGLLVGGLVISVLTAILSVNDLAF